MAGGRNVNLDLPQVLVAGGDGAVGVGHAPAAVVLADGRSSYRLATDFGHRTVRVAGAPGQQGDGFGGGRPQEEGGAAIMKGQAQLGGRGNLGIRTCKGLY